MKKLIIEAITELMGFDGKEIFQKSRKQKYVFARQMTFYYLKNELFWPQTKKYSKKGDKPKCIINHN